MCTRSETNLGISVEKLNLFFPSINLDFRGSLDTKKKRKKAKILSRLSNYLRLLLYRYCYCSEGCNRHIRDSFSFSKKMSDNFCLRLDLTLGSGCVDLHTSDISGAFLKLASFSDCEKYMKLCIVESLVWQ